VDEFGEDGECVQVAEELHVVGCGGLGAALGELVEYTECENVEENGGCEQEC